MQRDAFDVQPLAALFEFGRTVASANGAQIRKQRAVGRQCSQDRRRFVIKELNDPRAGLLAAKDYCAVLPIHVCGGQ